MMIPQPELGFEIAVDPIIYTRRLVEPAAHLFERTFDNAVELLKRDFLKRIDSGQFEDAECTCLYFRLKCLPYKNDSDEEASDAV